MLFRHPRMVMDGGTTVDDSEDDDEVCYSLTDSIELKVENTSTQST